MTFTKEEINDFDVDINDEWQFPDSYNDYASVGLNVGDWIRERVCKFLNINYEDVIYDGWIDIYAGIDVNKKQVSRIYINVISDGLDDGGRDMEILITNQPEATAIYEQLCKTDGFIQFIEECKEAM